MLLVLVLYVVVIFLFTSEEDVVFGLPLLLLSVVDDWVTGDILVSGTCTSVIGSET